MKTLFTQIAFTALLVFLIGCHDDETLTSLNEKVRVEFDSAQVTIFENVQQRIISLSFKEPAINDGLLTFSLKNAAPTRYTTEPSTIEGRLTLPFFKGQQTASITIKTVDNLASDGNLESELSLTATSDIIVGEKNSVSMKFIDDDSPLQMSVVNFIEVKNSLSEQDLLGKSISLQVSQPLQAAGSIEVSVNSANAAYGTHFTTVPELKNGKLLIVPAIGDAGIGITIVPVNNSIITGDLKITLEITATDGALAKGTKLSHEVTIVDDELLNKPKGYEMAGGQWALKKIYEYDAQGKVSQVHIEKSTPATSRHTETYHYDALGRIQKINSYPQIDVVFTWSTEQIIKAESFHSGVLKEYTEYDYDSRGNVSGTANYFRQQDGQFKLAFLNVYLYFDDGNLYKSQTYIPTEGSEEYSLISTRTFEGYTTKENPFPMVEILPTVKTQRTLPSIHTIEENGVKLIYTLSYEFTADGLVSQRIATMGSLSEISRYFYY